MNVKDIFSPARFFKYLKYDLIQAWSNFGLSAVILGLAPVAVYLSVNIFALIFVDGWTSGSIAIPIVAFSIAIITSVFSAGAKLYGKLTNKKAGSTWILVPASTLEKTLSIICIVCIAVPLVIGSLLICSDLILSLFPGYGDSLVLSIRDGLETVHEEGGIRINALGIAWIGWAQYLLIFVLGAVIFKKSKAAKTFLALFAISTLFGGLFGTMLTGTDLLKGFAEKIMSGDAAYLQRVINGYGNLGSLILFLIIGGGTYWRLSTLKH